jgi:hypothetical protein
MTHRGRWFYSSGFISLGAKAYQVPCLGETVTCDPICSGAEVGTVTQVDGNLVLVEHDRDCTRVAPVTDPEA